MQMTAPGSPTFNLVNPAVTMPDAAAGTAGGEKGRGGTEFDFESGRVKPWEGERIHDVAVDDLELTLGVGNTASK